MVGKMVLPSLGGAAAVWTTCVLFFQLMLLLGYVYAHLLARMEDVRKQMSVHAIILLTPLAFLPIRFSAAASEAFSLHPVGQLLAALMTTTAIPFFVVSTTAPLVQRWFSRTTHRDSTDPYFLYSASNAGSLLALISYPFLVEPRLGVAAQSQLWFWGYLGLLAMLAMTAAALGGPPAPQPAAVSQADRRNPAWTQRLYWVGASFVPSALMLAVTNHVAANVGSTPFLWIVPLALYLTTFIFAFAQRARFSSRRVSRIVPLVLLAIFPLVATEGAPPGLSWIVIAAHLVLLFVGALLCHTRLAESRPEPRQLTEFYLWVAVGGVLGGVFTAIAAPLFFSTVVEYPLLVATLPFFRGGSIEKSQFLIAAGIALAIFVTWVVFRATGLDSNTEAVALAHTALVFTGYKLRKHTQRFAALFAVLMLAYTLILPGYLEGANRIYVGRDFFGVKKILDEPTTHLRKLFHGDTIHGIESTDSDHAGVPLSYYYPGGSVSDVFQMMQERGTRQRIGVVGLGAGTVAAYADARQHVTFYEIDPSIEPIARRYFTFLHRCAARCDVVVGDGRLQLAREPDASFDLLFLDAFSSDSIPMHLLSREALQMYLAKLRADGVLLFHVSNRYLNVEELVKALVREAGLAALSRFDDAGDLRRIGKTSASHVVAARRPEDLDALSARPAWRAVELSGDLKPWTDDYSNLLGLIRWH